MESFRERDVGVPEWHLCLVAELDLPGTQTVYKSSPMIKSPGISRKGWRSPQCWWEQLQPARGCPWLLQPLLVGLACLPHHTCPGGGSLRLGQLPDPDLVVLNVVMGPAAQSE